MNADQRTVLTGMMGAAIFSLLFVLLGTTFSNLPQPSIHSPGERIAYVLRCDFWAVFALLAGVGRVAARRFFSNQIDGTVPAEGRSLQVDRAYIQNTTEQILLLLMGHLGLALVLAPEDLIVIPWLVALFLIGRVTFWLGYSRSAPARAFGFATTFYPSVVVCLYVGLRLITG